MMVSLQLWLKQFLRKIQSLDGWMVLSYILGIYLFLIFCYFIYLQWIIPSLEGKVFEEQEKLQNLNTITNQANNSPLYKKYKNAKLITKQESKLQRGRTIPILISTLQKLQIQGESSQLQITDFQINIDKISVRGSINDLKNIYQSGGVLDTFMDLGFIESLDVPFYKQYAGKYEFLLEAKINHNYNNGEK